MVGERQQGGLTFSGYRLSSVKRHDAFFHLANATTSAGQ